MAEYESDSDAEEASEREADALLDNLRKLRLEMEAHTSTIDTKSAANDGAAHALHVELASDLKALARDVASGGAAGGPEIDSEALAADEGPHASPPPNPPVDAADADPAAAPSPSAESPASSTNEPTDALDAPPAGRSAKGQRFRPPVADSVAGKAVTTISSLANRPLLPPDTSAAPPAAGRGRRRK